MGSVGRRRFGIGATVALLTVMVFGTTAASSQTVPESALAGWPRQLGTIDREFVTAVATAPDYSVYVAGNTEGAFPGFINQGLGDGFLARFDKYGRLKWVRQFGSDSFDSVSSVAIVGDAVYVGGQTRGSFPGAVNRGGGDTFLIRFDPTGSQLWLRQIETPDFDERAVVAATPAGVFVFGGTGSPNYPTLGAGYAWLARFDGAGTQNWFRRFGSETSVLPGGITVLDNGVYLSGATFGSFLGQVNRGGLDAFVARFDTAGTQQWVRQVGSNQTDRFNAIAVAAGGIYLGGTLGGYGAVARFDTAGNQTWTHRLTDPDTPAHVTAVAVSAGRVYAAGGTSGTFPGYAKPPTSSGDYDGFLARFDTAGNRRWLRQFGTARADYITAITIRGSESFGGSIVTAGTTYGVVWGQTGQLKDGEYAGDAFIATFPS